MTEHGIVLEARNWNIRNHSQGIDQTSVSRAADFCDDYGDIETIVIGSGAGQP
jgi:hypothetical protein